MHGQVRSDLGSDDSGDINLSSRRFDSRNSEIRDVLSWATVRHATYAGNLHALSSAREAKALN